MKKLLGVVITLILGTVGSLIGTLVWENFPIGHIVTFIIGLCAGIAVCTIFLQDSTKGRLNETLPTLLSRKSLVFVPKTTLGYDGVWQFRTIRGESMMHAYGEWTVTNISDTTIQLLSAYLEKPEVEAVVILPDQLPNRFDESVIYDGVPTQIDVHLWIPRPSRMEGESFKGKIVFIDQFDTRHRVKAQFKGHSNKGTLIVKIRTNLSLKRELDKKRLPETVRKRLESKGQLLSQNVAVSVCKKGKVWVIKDSDLPDLVYTAKVERNRLCLFRHTEPPKKNADR